MPSPVVGAPTPQITEVESHKRDWTIVSWCYKVADSVSSKFEEGSTVGKWLGRTVAAVFVPFGIVPALVGDVVHGFKSLYDRHVVKKEAVEKKIPTQAEFTALKAENETLLKKVSVAEADISKARLENLELNKRAEIKTNALVRNNREGQALFKEKAQKAFDKERGSKVRCIRRQHSELKAKTAQLAAQSEALKNQEQQLADQCGKNNVLQRALDANAAKLVELTSERNDYKDGAKYYKKKADYYQKRASDEKLKAGFAAGELREEQKKAWQIKYLEKFIDRFDKFSVSNPAGSEDQDEPTSEYKVSAPGAVERLVRLNPNQYPAFRARLERVKELINSLENALTDDLSLANEDCSTKTNPNIASASSDGNVSDNGLFDLADSETQAAQSLHSQDLKDDSLNGNPKASDSQNS